MDSSATRWINGGGFTVAAGAVAAAAGLISGDAPLWLIGALSFRLQYGCFVAQRSGSAPL